MSRPPPRLTRPGRSRGSLWEKGETSGNALLVREVRVDCDADVVRYLVDADGPSCHTGETSCFYRKVEADGALVEDHGPAPATIVDRFADVIATRRLDRPAKSYVVSLLDAGWPKILGKIAEESGELTESLPQADAAHSAHETANLIFHILVGLEATGVSPSAVYAQLRQRFGVSGIDEKASRKPRPAAERGEDAGSPAVRLAARLHCCRACARTGGLLGSVCRSR